MSETETTAGRLLSLLSLLQGRRDWPGGELQERLGVSARTVRRDMARLRELGYPIESISGPAGGYRLQAGTAMPPLLLDDEEATAVAIALRTAARSAVAGIEETALRALVKLEQVLPAHLRRRVRALGEATSTPAPAWPGQAPGRSVDAQALTLLAGACRDCELVRFLYAARDGRRTRRVVEPHALVALGRRWYLVAWDPGRSAWRTFRLDRVEQLREHGRRFAARTIPGVDAAAFVRRSIGALSYRYEATVTYDAPVEQLRGRLAYGWGTLEALDEQTCVYRTSDDDLEWLAFRIGMAGADFSVEGPPELREALGRVGARFAAAAAGSG
ncbi:MAG TPA: YafY family protein [Solirubrobacteraceae bacterium]|nr:YafY family protein [Solirubrobacteraceae bacterium]